MDNNTISAKEYLPRSLNVWGLVVLIIFYLVILVVGIWASVKNKTLKTNETHGLLLLRRNLGGVVGILTLTASWVGGGYINGTAEYVFTPGYGFAWTQGVWGYTVSIFLNGIFFAKPMRAAGYTTMLDPYKVRYGNVLAGLLYIPALLSELFYAAAILAALGSSLTVILAVSNDTAILISTAIAVLYTVLGGLFSVVWTDVVQLFFIFGGLWIGVIFGMLNPAVTNISKTAIGAEGWLGKLIPDKFVGLWIDSALLIIFGGIPWQSYYQRVLSADSPRTAQIMTFGGGIGTLFLAMPAILIGAVAKSADWNATDYSLHWPVPVEESNYPLILPLVFEYLTPPVVSIVGLAAISAAVMSSSDSSLLGNASMFACNVYKPLRNFLFKRTQATEAETMWVMRGTIIVLGALAAVIAIEVKSIYALFVLCSDLVYTITFPQLACAVYLKNANTYGAMCGYIIGFFFRLTAGEPLLSFPPLIKYWYFDEATETQCFPTRTFAMLLGLLTLILVSEITHRFLPERFDIIHAIYKIDKEDHPDEIKKVEFWKSGYENGKTVDGVLNMEYQPEFVTTATKI